MKVYTKKGDEGSTGLIGGTRVPKDHIRIEAYGTVDELNSHVGMLRDSGIDERSANWLVGIQEELFTIGSQLAADPENNKMELPNIDQEDIDRMEAAIDTMDESLPEMRNFVLPGGSLAVSQSHVCRCVCRRAERRTMTLNTESEVPALVLPYLNRLSDFFFVLARYLAFSNGVKETPWKPRMK